jgi:hypothetical protein
MNGELLRENLLRLGLAKPHDIVGCSEDDLKTLEQQAGAPLPATYLAFMRANGRKCGEFMRDLTIFFPEVLQLTEQTRRDEIVDLPNDSFVFMDHLGDTLLFFRLVDGDDPPIYG